MFRPLISPRRRRQLAGALVALALVVTAAACEPGPPVPENAPYWTPGSTVDASMRGPMVHIEWDATGGGDPAATYQISFGTYNGTLVASVPASVRSCVITGVAANTAYTIFVTARDAQGHWSGPLSGTKGNRKTTINTINQAGPGGLTCRTDVDADALPDVWETDDGSYTGLADTGSDPAVADTDNDGIPDGTEVLGRPGLDLVAMGARPTRKDLFVETDWLDDPACPSTGHRPTAGGIDPMIDAFADALIANPDWTAYGIKLVVDYGQGGLYTGGNLIADADGRVDGNTAASSDFLAKKAANFAAARKGIFHYAILTAHVGGDGELGGDDLTVGRGCNGNDDIAFARYIMHELGHNLDLHHGGYYTDGGFFQLTTKDKPNYNSVMNYRFLDGLDADCNGHSDSGIGYSYGTNNVLDETDLDEVSGICGGQIIDWNVNGVADHHITWDTNYDGQFNERRVIGGPLLPLEDHDDWAHIETVGLADFADDPD